MNLTKKQYNELTDIEHSGRGTVESISGQQRETDQVSSEVLSVIGDIESLMEEIGETPSGSPAEFHWGKLEDITIGMSDAHTSIENAVSELESAEGEFDEAFDMLKVMVSELTEIVGELDDEEKDGEEGDADEIPF